jgi:tRNA pseudouridine55 synthase
MSAKGAKRRAVDGVLLLDKPSGITSHTAVQKVRRLFDAAKAGHTGTLDPLATGLLPVCLGEATKFSHSLLEADKTYLAARFPVKVEAGEVAAALKCFIGETRQTPPMYSAIKHAGQPLYKLARAGHEIAREPRRVFISSLDLIQLAGHELTVRVCCSKGTYVRVLAEDIGRKLFCGGALSALRREAVGGFALSSGAVTLEQIEQLTLAERDALLLPADALVSTLPRFDLNAIEARRMSQGQPVDRTGVLAEGLARIYGPDRKFLGVAEVTGPGRIVPKRLTVTG